jgi:hypothetical protein
MEVVWKLSAERPFLYSWEGVLGFEFAGDERHGSRTWRFEN